MYICNNCKTEFDWPIKVYEKHHLDSPPYEGRYVCPICQSGDYQKFSSDYCQCCGAKLKNPEDDYCSYWCRKKGEKLWKKQHAKNKQICDSALYQKVREIERHNFKNNTSLSYGRYVATYEPQKKVKK